MIIWDMFYELKHVYLVGYADDITPYVYDENSTSAVTKIPIIVNLNESGLFESSFFWGIH